MGISPRTTNNVFVEFKTCCFAPGHAYRQGHVYHVTDTAGNALIKAGYAVATDKKPPEIAALYDRLEIGKDATALFLPFVGEYGHLIMSHLRIVHFNKAKRKIVCCQPGQQCLFPAASAFITDWTNPIADAQRIGSAGSFTTALKWPELTARHPHAAIVPAGNLQPEAEVWILNQGEIIPFAVPKPAQRVDVLLGVRQRGFAPERNWQHWQRLADQITAAGYTFGVMGLRDTAPDLHGQTLHTNGNCALAIGLMQAGSLYVGQDSGGSHLAAEAQAKMILFRCNDGSRNLIDRMRQVNRQPVEFAANGWDEPAALWQTIHRHLDHATATK